MTAPGAAPALGDRPQALPSVAAGTVRLVLSLLGVVVCAAALFLLGAVAVDTPRGQRVDQLVLSAGRGDRGRIADLVFPALDVVTVPVVIALLVLGAIVALVRRRPGLLVHMAAVVGGSNLTTQALKLMIDRTELAKEVDPTTNSFPSGHTTLAASVALVLVLVAPLRVRGLIGVLGALWTAAVGIGTIAQGWHRPSDVVGALLVCGAWTLLALAVDAVAYLVRRHRLAADLAPSVLPSPSTLSSPSTRSSRPPLSSRPRGSAGPDGSGADGDTQDPAGPPSGAEAGRRTWPARVPHHGRVAAVVLLVLGLVALLAGLVQLASIPTPLVLSDTSQQRTSYLAAIFAITGCSGLLSAAVLLLHTPDLRRYRDRSAGSTDARSQVGA